MQGEHTAYSPSCKYHPSLTASKSTLSGNSDFKTSGSLPVSHGAFDASSAIGNAMILSPRSMQGAKDKAHVCSALRNGDASRSSTCATYQNYLVNATILFYVPCHVYQTSHTSRHIASRLPV